MSDIDNQIERGGAGPEWQASHRTHYQLHPDLVDEVNALRIELAEMRAALETLVDEQNGPPLARHADSWRKAMCEAARLLGRSESERYYSDEEE